MGFWGDIKSDYRAVFERDPAARNGLEVILAYPGFHAIFWHRINHRLWNLGIPILPRLLSHIARFLTGIEIHPGASIGKGLVIDHGMGVVIGETAEVGDNCLLYQGVTLGGTGKEKGKRHPTLKNNVVVGTGAKILGAITVGNNVIIGANSVILKPVPDNSICVGVPGRITRKKILRMTTEDGMVEVMDYFPDPVVEKQKELESRIDELTKRLDSVERAKERGGRMKIYNTLTGKKEEFIPEEAGRVGMYACGVTVYDHCHIGHARSAVVFDVMRRYMISRGYQFKYIRNFTDIDDKIINKAKQEGIAWDAVARKYTEEYYRDMDRLGVGRADVEPKATDHIEEIVEIVKGLVEKGFAYERDGSVYFEVEKFHGYGKLSKRDLEDMMAGARVEVDERKRNPMDFALWKASKEGEPSWESPWGQGRPGWHIECSAMSLKHLGETFDIHGGGADLIFPHHENEIAQSESYTGRPFVRYWVHNGFITVDKEKMSKSLGNFFTIQEILNKFDAEAVRFFLLSTHYRSPIEFSDEQLREAEASIDRYYTTVLRIRDFLSQESTKEKPGPDEKALSEMLGKFLDKFREAMDDDFNTALAIGTIFELVRMLNKYMDSRPSGSQAVELIKKADEMLRETGNVLNLFHRTPEEWYRALMAVKGIGLTEDDILARITERQAARERKDWADADFIRKELDEKGILLEDRKDGTGWKVRV
ncbi:Cysteine--tRNA ligase (modular protein) [Candidatus Sulfobium mesophilum]|uniref:Cysteine--tRNA ligase n=1 Tax=Candidatus Sulfobium mesophilum TaxID=2016548 RepID=A0A2U3QH63_9BACT|nr:Cysteine--tRNA ligase (modular protein) [Candidatus Sulfobium mesophilum]